MPRDGERLKRPRGAPLVCGTGRGSGRSRRPFRRTLRIRSEHEPEHLDSQLEPGALPAADGMVNAGRRVGGDEGVNLPGDVGRPSGLAMLVVDHRRTGAGTGQPDHGADETGTMRAVQPGGPDNVAAVGQGGADGLLAGQLGPTVGATWSDRRSKISGSYVGPFAAVAPECTVDDSEIEYSIVLRGASIRGVRRIEASLIGHDVEVTPAPRVPRAHRLILGDHSKVQISS